MRARVHIAGSMRARLSETPLSRLRSNGIFVFCSGGARKYPKCLDQRSYRRSSIQAIGNARAFAEVFSQNRAQRER